MTDILKSCLYWIRFAWVNKCILRPKLCSYRGGSGLSSVSACRHPKYQPENMITALTFSIFSMFTLFFTFSYPSFYFFHNIFNFFYLDVYPLCAKKIQYQTFILKSRKMIQISAESKARFFRHLIARYPRFSVGLSYLAVGGSDFPVYCKNSSKRIKPFRKYFCYAKYSSVNYIWSIVRKYKL